MKARMGGIAAIAAIGLLCMAGVASAKSSKATAPVQLGNDFCNNNEPEDPVIGTIKFKRTGNEVVMKVVTDRRGTQYPVLRFAVRGPSCEFIGTPILIETNKKGKGKGTGSVTVPEGDTTFQGAVETLSFSEAECHAACDSSVGRSRARLSPRPRGKSLRPEAHTRRKRNLFAAWAGRGPCRKRPSRFARRVVHPLSEPGSSSSGRVFTSDAAR